MNSLESWKFYFSFTVSSGHISSRLLVCLLFFFLFGKMFFDRLLIFIFLVAIVSCYRRQCPENCACALDTMGRIENICIQNSWTDIPISEFDNNVEVLIIRGPGNHLSVGPIFGSFKHLEIIRVTDSNVPSVGMNSFWGVPTLRVLGKCNHIEFHFSIEKIIQISNETTQISRGTILPHWISTIFEAKNISSNWIYRTIKSIVWPVGYFAIWQ